MLLENIIAIAMLSILSVSFLPLIPTLSDTADSVRIHSKLSSIGDYIGQHVHRWAATDPSNKAMSFSSYLTEGTEFDISGETRVNSMIWTQKLMSKGTYLSDHYKASVTFRDTGRSTQRSAIKITVWYDTDLEGDQDSSEPTFTFSTMVSELK